MSNWSVRQDPRIQLCGWLYSEAANLWLRAHLILKTEYNICLSAVAVCHDPINMANSSIATAVKMLKPSHKVKDK